MLRIEPYDDIQVFVVGTGCCLWGRIQPDCRRARTRGTLGGIRLELTAEPLQDTVTQLRQAGVRFETMVAPLRGTKAFVRHSLVDIVFGDRRRRRQCA